MGRMQEASLKWSRTPITEKEITHSVTENHRHGFPCVLRLLRSPGEASVLPRHRKPRLHLVTHPRQPPRGAIDRAPECAWARQHLAVGGAPTFVRRSELVLVGQTPPCAGATIIASPGIADACSRSVADGDPRHLPPAARSSPPPTSGRWPRPAPSAGRRCCSRALRRVDVARRYRERQVEVVVGCHAASYR